MRSSLLNRARREGYAVGRATWPRPLPMLSPMMTTRAQRALAVAWWRGYYRGHDERREEEFAKVIEPLARAVSAWHAAMQKVGAQLLAGMSIRRAPEPAP